MATAMTKIQMGLIMMAIGGFLAWFGIGLAADMSGQNPWWIVWTATPGTIIAAGGLAWMRWGGNVDV